MGMCCSKGYLGGQDHAIEACSVFEYLFFKAPATPDMLPADVVGTQNSTRNPANSHATKFRANVVLADEINRAPAKVQSALLEAAGAPGNHW